MNGDDGQGIASSGYSICLMVKPVELGECLEMFCAVCLSFAVGGFWLDAEGKCFVPLKLVDETDDSVKDRRLVLALRTPKGCWSLCSQKQSMKNRTT
jgi:hypothetical protein